MHLHSDLLLKLLAKRGITDEQEIEKFLNPDYERDMYDSFLLRDMERSVSRLYKAIDNNEKIIIYADYDCDGIPGAVILADLFKKIKYENYEVYIPERNSEGYGLNIEAIDLFKEKEIKLIITIDLGITAIAEVELTNSFGIDVIITDHHLPIKKNPDVKNSPAFALGDIQAGDPRLLNFSYPDFSLPKAYAILNPKVDEYPEKMLCGSGVIFKFVQGFLKKYGEHYKINNGWEKWLLDMAGLATLSDMVPLVGENRTLAYFGLKVFRKSPRLGLQKLLAKMNIDQKHISEDDIGFMVTPRLNAASRMDSPMRAFEILSTLDEVEAGTLATHLSKINDERKSIVLGIMKHVKKVFERREIGEVIVIGDGAWRIGVLGLVAGKIADEYDKVVFVWGKDENDIIKGSCRSPGSCSVVELMSLASEHFIDYGGHELAGGFAVHNDKIHYLEEELCKVFKNIKKENTKEKVAYDISTTLSSVNMKNWKDLELMAPFGLANPKPTFLFENVNIEKIKKFGKNGSGEHLEIIFSDATAKNIKAIAFFSNTESFTKNINDGGRVNLLATFDLSRFAGKVELRLRIIDII
ncbi:MAG: DHH family phosphoesterase [bacterium]|nr:DHH family phosphoesterase [bacterium]